MSIRLSFRSVLVAAMAAVSLLTLGGCSAGGLVNYATADAMSYGKLRNSDPRLREALKKVSESPEHRNIQHVIANLPEDMAECLVIEIAKVPEAGEDAVPVIMAMFVADGSMGFLSNVFIGEDGSIGEPGGAWQCAVWPVPKGAGDLLPDDPAEILRSGETEPVARPEMVVILTLANRQRVFTLALWDDGSVLSPQGRLVSDLRRRGVASRLTNGYIPVRNKGTEKGVF